MKKSILITLTIVLLLATLALTGLPSSASASTAKIVGDLDQNGEITDWDSVLFSWYLAGWSLNTPEEKIMDIDGDGEITDWDSVLLDRYLAGWDVETQIGKPLGYQITYTNTKGATNTNPASYDGDGTAIELAALSAEHYIFDGWYIGDEQVTTIPTDRASDLTITAHWTPVEYTITYANTKDVTNNNPTTYTIEDTLTLSEPQYAPSRLGYTFEGWYNGENKVTEIAAGSAGNLTLTAKWTPFVYTFTFFDMDDAENPNTLTETTLENWPGDYTLKTPSRDGYRFDGWVIDMRNGTTYSTTTITLAHIKAYNKDGVLYIRAKWTELTVIYTASDFSNIKYTPDGMYQLGATITISSTICDSDNPFSGYFDGNGYKINGAKPFGTISGTVTNLTTENSLATTNTGTLTYCTGGNGLVAVNAGTIYRCGSTDGYVTSGDYAGGLVAKNSGTIEESFSKGSVSGKKNVGGFVGANSGHIKNSYATGNAVASEFTVTRAAGFVAENNGNGTIYYCYAAGSVYSYSKDVTTGYVTMGEAYAAGLFGRNYGSTISNCFFAGSTVYARGSGGSTSAAISHSYYMNSSNYYSSSLSVPAVNSGTSSSSAPAYATATSADNFLTPVFIKNTMKWDASIWRLVGGQLPALAWEN